MGRGRAKAKQTKVARDLKYRTVETDFERLQRELQEAQAAEADQDNGGDTGETDEDPYTHDPYVADPSDGDAESAQRP